MDKREDHAKIYRIFKAYHIVMVLILNHINSDISCEQSLVSRFWTREKSPILFGILALEKIIQLRRVKQYISSCLLGKNEFQRAFNSERISGPFFRRPPHLRIPSSSVKSNNEALIWSNFLSAKTDFCTYLIRSSFA